MDHLEKVEELVARTGCSYADAKDALVAADWNMLDAIIALEREGKVEKSSAAFSTDGTSDAYIHEEPAAENAGASGTDRGPAYTARETAREKRSRFADTCRSFFKAAKQALTMNYVDIFSRNGNQLVHLPIWAALIPLMIWFWGVIILCLVLMVLGCRFHFEGRDFGKTRINETIDRASQAAYDAGQRVKQEFSGKSEGPSDPGSHEE